MIRPLAHLCALALFCALALCIILVQLAGPSAAQEADTAGYAARVELHAFESLTLTDAQFLTGRAETAREADAKPVTLAGALRIAKPGTERLPTVVLIHGSGGIGGNIEFWQRALNARGISTFAIDGFTGRGLTSVNTDQSRLGRTNLILDLYRGLEILAKHPRVDPLRVAVMGFSRGGQAALYASLRRFDEAWNRSGIQPAAYLPLYPDCSIIFEGDTDVTPHPIRILAGGADDYNPAAFCANYVERLQANGRDATITVYPGGQHVFDNPIGPAEPTVVAGAQTVRACAIREEPRGRIIDARTGADFSYRAPCVETGPHIGSDAGIRTDALREVLGTLNTAFGTR